MRWTILIIVTLLMQFGANPVKAARTIPEIYPKIFQRLPGRYAESDWAKMTQYDVISLTRGWALHSANGNIDSLRAIRDRNPDLVVLIEVSTGYSCSNWGSEELIGKMEWANQLMENGDLWILRDTDGDRFILERGQNCAEGRLNFASIDMARAYAHYLANSTVVPYGDLIDGFDIDELHASIWWWNEHYRAPLADHVDSLDLNQDGIADTKEQVDSWWTAGVDTFVTTFSRLIGDRYIMVNGHAPPSVFHLINGRFHEGFPKEEGKGWEYGMTDPVYGALVSHEINTASPGPMEALFSVNHGNPYQFDPNGLSTKEAPYNHHLLPKFRRFGLGSSMLAENCYALSGMGYKVDWNGDPTPGIYQTLWWFPEYDTLQTYMGTPVSSYTRGESPEGRDRLMRNFTGGRVRVYPDREQAIFDLRPLVNVDAVHASVRTGEPMPIGWSTFDPNGTGERLTVTIDLSRDGGASFPEHLGTAGAKDTLFTWTATGEWPDSCLIRISATDTTGLTGTAFTPLFAIAPPVAVSGGEAEIHPPFWIVNTPAVECTVIVKADLNDSTQAGWKEAHILIPDETALVAFHSVESGGAPLAASYTLSGDTLQVTLDNPFSSAAAVMIRFDLAAPSQIPEVALRFEAGLRADLAGDPITWLEEGDANSVTGDGDDLSVVVGTGPAVELTASPLEAELTAGDTLLFSAIARDAVGNEVIITPAWMAEDTLGTIDGEGLFHAIRPGTMKLFVAASSLYDTMTVSISAGVAATLAISPDGLVLSTGSSYPFLADIRDNRGNPLDHLPQWLATDSIGLIDSLGLFTSTGKGTGIIRANWNGLSDSSSIEVLDTFLTTALLPEAPVLSADSLLQFELLGITLHGDTTNLPVSWSLSGIEGAIDSSGLFTPRLTGSGMIVADAGAFIESTTVTVLPGSPDSLAITGEVTLVAGEALPLSAALYDQMGNRADGIVLFEASGACEGPFDPPFLCNAAGSAVIAARFESLTDTLEIVVGHAEPSTIAIAPQSIVAPVDTIISFSVESFDSYGNPVTSGWSFTTFGGIGVIDSEGEFSATTEGNGGVIASLASAADTAQVTVYSTPPPSPTITLTLQAPQRSYPASDWPDPWLFIAEVVDSLGRPALLEEPDSLSLIISPVDPGHAAPRFTHTVHAAGAFPESLLVPMDLIGGCGDMVMEAHTAGGLAAPPETLSFSTPDLDGNFTVDFHDVATLLDAIDSPGSGGVCDLNGDSLLGEGDIDAVASHTNIAADGTEPADGAPRWLQSNGNLAICPGESLVTHFVLYSETLDSIRALFLSFDLPPNAGAVSWQPSPGWSSTYIREMNDDPSTADWMIINDGIREPEGGPIVEIAVCGVDENDWATRGARLTAIDGNYEIVPTMQLEIEFQLAVEDSSGAPDTTTTFDSEGIPLAFTISHGRPNPFRDRTLIRYGLPRPTEEVAYNVFSLNGRLVANRSDLPGEAGFHIVEWDGLDSRGNDIAPGTYFIRFTIPSGSITRKLTLIR